MTYNIYCDALRSVSTSKRTENGANAFSTTQNAVVDLFATIGAMRNANESIWTTMDRLSSHVDAAYAEDPLLTAKILFYARDVRGGLGEREIFRMAMFHCAAAHPEVVSKNIRLIPEYGRWDDLFSLLNTPLEGDMWKLIAAQLAKDHEALGTGQPVSLLAKWMPSAKTSSADTMMLARRAAENLGMSVYRYKRYIRDLRRHLDLLEQRMSAKQWSEVDYGHLPSQAHMRHVKAFYRNDGARYTEYLEAVFKGEKRINTSTLFPYEIVERITPYSSKRESYELMWKNLPDYVGEGRNVMVIADTSGSMTGRPMDTSVSLAIYFAERNRGPFANMYMTFSDRPQIVMVNPEDSLLDKIHQVMRGPWGQNTDLEAALKLLLDVAVHIHAKQEDLPVSLMVITDMEIDMGSVRLDRPWETIVDVMEQRYREAGYTMPNIVFWNVASRHDTYLSTADHKGLQLVSGSSASVFRSALGYANGMTPIEAVRQTLDVPRYSAVTV